MLTEEAQERLTRVGPGTPMGELMRRYWIPVRPLSQLQEQEIMPIRILGEDLVLFITKKGESVSQTLRNLTEWVFEREIPIEIVENSNNILQTRLPFGWGD